MNAGVCERHGNEYDGEFRSGCWECDMEADEAARDRAEDVTVAEYKLTRDTPFGFADDESGYVFSYTGQSWVIYSPGGVRLGSADTLDEARIALEQMRGRR